MGIPAESPVIRLQNRPGVALAAAIFGIVVVSLITVGAWTVTDLDLKSTTNRVDAARALGLAHTASAHALSVLNSQLKDTSFTRVLRGFDGLSRTADDGLLKGFPGLGDSLSIPATGRVVSGLGTYYVRITDDPKETDGLALEDSNNRLLLTCRGVTTSGSTAEINVVVAAAPRPVPGTVARLSAITVNGNLTVAAASTVDATGDCGSIHANGNITGSSVATVEQPATATGSITHTSLRPGVPNSPRVDVPNLNWRDYCTGPNVVKINGNWSPKLADIYAKYGNGKTFCVSGNLQLTGDVATTSIYASFVTSGYLKTSGSGFNHLIAAHPSGLVLMAGGDLIVGGNGTYTGTMYSYSQCEMPAAVTVYGHLVCANNPDPSARAAKITVNKLSGNSTFYFDCNSSLSSATPVMTNGAEVVAWYPTIGS